MKRHHSNNQSTSGESPYAVRARYVTSACRHTKPGPAALADYLAGYKARGQGAWPKQIHLAAVFGVSTRTIRRWSGQLEEADMLTVKRSTPHHDHITGRWKRRSNRYYCHFQETKRGRMKGKGQVTPSGHFWPIKAHFVEPCSEAAPPPVDVPPLDPPEEPAVGPPWVRLGITRHQWKESLSEE